MVKKIIINAVLVVLAFFILVKLFPLLMPATPIMLWLKIIFLVSLLSAVIIYAFYMPGDQHPLPAITSTGIVVSLVIMIEGLPIYFLGLLLFSAILVVYIRAVFKSEKEYKYSLIFAGANLFIVVSELMILFY